MWLKGNSVTKHMHIPTEHKAVQDSNLWLQNACWSFSSTYKDHHGVLLWLMIALYSIHSLAVCFKFLQVAESLDFGCSNDFLMKSAWHPQTGGIPSSVACAEFLNEVRDKVHVLYDHDFAQTISRQPRHNQFVDSAICVPAHWCHCHFEIFRFQQTSQEVLDIFSCGIRVLLCGSW